MLFQVTGYTPIFLNRFTEFEDHTFSMYVRFGMFYDDEDVERWITLDDSNLLDFLIANLRKSPLDYFDESLQYINFRNHKNTNSNNLLEVPIVQEFDVNEYFIDAYD